MIKIIRSLSNNGLALLKSKQHWLVTVLECLLILVLMNQLAILIWQLLNHSKPDIPTYSSVTSVRDDLPEQNGYSGLDQYHFFGVVAPEIKAPSAQKQRDVASIPRSRLPLKLTGLLAHSNPKLAIAVIESKGQQGSYRLGDKVGSRKAEIVDIKTDRVIVSVKGKEEALMLYPDQKTSTVTEFPRSKTLQDLVASPEKITELISISPVRRGGSLVGYRVNPKQNSKFFYQSGLKNNDLVTALNGMDLTDSAQAVEVLNNLETLQQIDLTVVREGMLHQVELSL